MPDRKSPKRAKVFTNGRSQAVRLPKEFRFSSKEVSVRKEGEAVILEPIHKRKWPKGYWKNASRSRRRLELGPLEPLPSRLLDVSLKDE